jgi:hypothetical protein
VLYLTEIPTFHEPGTWQTRLRAGKDLRGKSQEQGLASHLTNGKTAIAAKLGRNKPPDEIENIAILLPHRRDRQTLPAIVGVGRRTLEGRLITLVSHAARGSEIGLTRLHHSAAVFVSRQRSVAVGAAEPSPC